MYNGSIQKSLYKLEERGNFWSYQADMKRIQAEKCREQEIRRGCCLSERNHVKFHCWYEGSIGSEEGNTMRWKACIAMKLWEKVFWPLILFITDMHHNLCSKSHASSSVSTSAFSSIINVCILLSVALYFTVLIISSCISLCSLSIEETLWLHERKLMTLPACTLCIMRNILLYRSCLTPTSESWGESSWKLSMQRKPRGCRKATCLT